MDEKDATVSLKKKGTVGDVWCLVPENLLFAHYWKANVVYDVKQREQKKKKQTNKHSKQNSTNKIEFIYQQIQKKETLQIF